VADLIAALRLSCNGTQNGEAGKAMSGVEAEGSITVNRPVDEIFAYW
jgi:uncharacterized membrane protein